jgi:hypothetical protein
MQYFKFFENYNNLFKRKFYFKNIIYSYFLYFNNIMNNYLLTHVLDKISNSILDIKL